jgi:tetratricopeptide (TPR) repeat protein
MDNIFGDKSRLPAAARRDYTFQSPPTTAPTARRDSWNRALAVAASSRLADAARAFEELTQQDATDAAAWYNLGLVRAWLGDNPHALEALDRYVSLESNESLAAAAWTLAEVLRFGQGMEDQADYVEHTAVFQIREPRGFFDFLRAWQADRRITAVQVNEQEGMVTGIVLDRGGLLAAGAAQTQPARLGAYLLILGNAFILRSVNNESLDRARQEVQQRAGPLLSEARMTRGPAAFTDVLSAAVLFPFGATDQEEAQKQVREHVQRHFEETWIHKPLKSLGGVPPVDAAGHTVLRRKLLGVVQFLEDCSAGGAQPYEFDRLRRKLGLVGGVATTPAPAVAAPSMDIAAMGAAELAGLQADNLSEEQADHAYQAAQRLDAKELASKFARALVGRPANPDRPDRFPWYTYLVQSALAEGNADTALQYVDEGEKADCEQNEGRRRNDYELRRGQVLAKRGDPAAAKDVFERLLARVPDEMRFRGAAAESMLALKQGAAALQFAEQGLSKARQKNDRDSEQYFLELVSAARRQM